MGPPKKRVGSAPGSNGANEAKSRGKPLSPDEDRSTTRKRAHLPNLTSDEVRAHLLAWENFGRKGR
jgi:hypothetical protein